MHQHHGALRLMIILAILVLGGLAVYFVLVYGLGRAAVGPVNTSSSTSVYFPISSSTGSVQNSSTTSESSTASTNASTTEPAWEQGMTVVTNADNMQTVQLTKNERFVIQLGDSLKWNLAFDPSTGITRVANSTTSDGIQGIYEADQVGTTTLHATGAPICKPGEACPDFMLEMVVTFVVH